MAGAYLGAIGAFLDNVRTAAVVGAVLLGTPFLVCFSWDMNTESASPQMTRTSKIATTRRVAMVVISTLYGTISAMAGAAAGNSTQKARTRRFRMTLRGLFALVTLAAALSGAVHMLVTT